MALVCFNKPLICIVYGHFYGKKNVGRELFQSIFWSRFIQKNNKRIILGVIEKISISFLVSTWTKASQTVDKQWTNSGQTVGMK